LQDQDSEHANSAHTHSSNSIDNIVNIHNSRQAAVVAQADLLA